MWGIYTELRDTKISHFTCPLETNSHVGNCGFPSCHDWSHALRKEKEKKIKSQHDCEHLSSDQSIPCLSSHSFTRKADGSQVWQGKAPGSLGTSIWTAGHPATGCCRCQMLPRVQGTEQTLKKNPQGLPKNLIWLRKLQTGREWECTWASTFRVALFLNSLRHLLLITAVDYTRWTTGLPFLLPSFRCHFNLLYHM